MLSYLAARGIVCFSAQYRLAIDHAFPANMIDLKHAISFVRKNAAKYGGDGRFIVLSGGSAGGHLALLMTLSSEREKDVFQPSFESENCSVQGLIGLVKERKTKRCPIKSDKNFFL